MGLTLRNYNITIFLSDWRELNAQLVEIAL